MSFSEIKFTVGGAIEVPDQVRLLKAQLVRSIHDNKVIWSIEIVGADEPSARQAMSELRHALADALLEED